MGDRPRCIEAEPFTWIRAVPLSRWIRISEKNEKKQLWKAISYSATLVKFFQFAPFRYPGPSAESHYESRSNSRLKSTDNSMDGEMSTSKLAVLSSQPALELSWHKNIDDGYIR